MRLVLQQSRPLRLATVCAMYLAQGIPFGFVTSALKTYLIDQGTDTAAVGQMIAVLALPWTFKFLFGPILDRFVSSPLGRRRPWILFAQIGMLLTIAAMLGIDTEKQSLTLLIWLVFAHNVFAALQDVSTDALAIDIIPPNERGKANGLMFGCAYVGRFFGGFIIGRILFATNMTVALSIQIVLLALLFLVPLFAIERPQDQRFPKLLPKNAPPRKPHPHTQNLRFTDLFRRLLKAFANRNALAGAVLAICANIGAAALAVVGAAYLQNTVGWTKESYLGLEGVAVWAGLAGCIAGGWLSDKLGGRNMVMLSTAAYGSMWLLWFALQNHWHNHPLVYTLTTIDTALQGAFSVALFAWFMSLCDKQVAATQFTAFMALLNLSILIGSSSAGWVESQLGFPTALLAFAAFQIALLIIPWLSSESTPPPADKPPHPDPAPESLP
ncbi:MAG: MFS transporter [Verrucomicrobiota bacterium]